MAGRYLLFVRSAVVGKAGFPGIARTFQPLAGDLCRGMEDGPFYGGLLDHSLGNGNPFADESMVKVGVGASLVFGSRSNADDGGF